MVLLKSCSDFFAIIPKAKTAKIVRSILDIVGAAGTSDLNDVSIAVCRDIIEWCKAEKRTFLRQRIESKLAALLLLKKAPADALVIVNSLLRELKKLGKFAQPCCMVLDDETVCRRQADADGGAPHRVEGLPGAAEHP